MATDRERQADEIEALSSIRGEDEFFKLPGQDYHLALDVSPILEKGKLDVKYSNVILKPCSAPIYRHFSVKNLPPSCLRIRLPSDYPRFTAPIYQLEINWLPPWECSLVCQKLDDMWRENRGSEILFLWQDFLQNDLLAFLNSDETLDVSYLFAIYNEPQNTVLTSFLDLSDERAKNGVLFIHPMFYLTRYDRIRRAVVFSRSFHVCAICTEEYSGQRCIEFSDCSHVCCANCVGEYFRIKIAGNESNKIYCPCLNCYSVASGEQIKQICPELYGKYVEAVLMRSLAAMNDVVFCPRRACQFPVVRDIGETLATCGNCEYSFCCFCRKGYHGVAPCAMTSEASLELLRAYRLGNRSQKQQLVRKHGRRQIQAIVEEHLSKEYLNKNTKPCPSCQTPTEKIVGCNKMVCASCRESFCWLCGIGIASKNAYDHFSIVGQGNTCFGRLFDGMPGAEDDEMPENHDGLPDVAG